MSYLNFISCATCHGLGSENLHRGLMLPSPPSLKKQEGLPSYFSIPGMNSELPYLQKMQALIEEQVREMENSCQGLLNQRWGIILASTKGVIEDQVWTSKSSNFFPFAPLLNFVEEVAPFSCRQSVVVSNACTSSHGALDVGQRWLKRDQVDHVFILALDLVGPFILKGFATLRALSESERVKPFDTNRDGLLLGDGIGSCVLSQNPTTHSFKIDPVVTLCEGVSATRPDASGGNLASCFSRALSQRPDLVLAHGTGTYYNDLTEARAIKQVFAKSISPPITCSKWSVGHSLGASGLMDLCLATEVLRTQQAPGIATLESSDLEVSEHLLKKPINGDFKSLLISSLGFGGMCSAFQIHQRGRW